MGTIGPNLVPNGTFDVDLSGWTGYSQSAVGWTGGRAQMTALSASNSRRLGTVANVSLQAYKRYLLTADLEVLTGTWTFSHITIGKFFGDPTVQHGPGIHKVALQTRIVPLGFTPGYIYIGSSYPGQAYIDNVQFREVLDMSNLILTLRDFDGDKKQTSVQMGPVTDGASYVARKAEADALETAVNAVAGNIARSQFLANDSEPNDTNAANLSYQTNIRWIVEWVDSVTGDGPYQTDIPTANITGNGLVLAGSVEHDPAAAEWIAFKTAFNGKVVNPRTGSTVNITRIFLEQ